MYFDFIYSIQLSFLSTRSVDNILSGLVEYLKFISKKPKNLFRLNFLETLSKAMLNVFNCLISFKDII